MKKVIKQVESPNLIVSHKNNEVIIKENVSWQEPVIIEKSKAREVALAICPELESEMKEAVELVKECYGMMSTHPEPTTLLYDKIRDFLTKHKKH